MKKRLICMLVAFVFAHSWAMAADDWETWNNYSFKLPPIKKNLCLKGAFETRFRDDLDEFYRYQFEMGPDYKLFTWLTLGFYYRIIEEGDPGEFQTEHRFIQQVTPEFGLKDIGIDRYRLGPLKISLQNRLEWRIRHYKDHVQTWRYRFYPKVSYPVFKTEKLTISPYVGNAFYFDFTNNVAFNQNRLYNGLSFKMFKHVVLDLYYMRLAKRSGRGGDWDGSHVIGTGLGYVF